MWYRSIKKAGYSTELAYLRDYVREGTNPYDYAFLVDNFLDSHEEYRLDPSIMEDVEDYPDERGYTWLNNAPDDYRKAFVSFLNDSRERYQYDNSNAYESPAYNSLEYQRALRPDWLVHFTENARDIENEGFKYGHPDIEGVHLSTWKEDRMEDPGYNFAFQVDSNDL